jgi:SAM-dependent methyltransferase
MAWQAFEKAAAGYESWYESPRGRRAAAAEFALLRDLIRCFPSARSAVEVGCGTGHFTRLLGDHGVTILGIDRSPAMLAEARRKAPDLPLLQADAHRLPLCDRCVDVVFFVTTLEFLERPEAALAEALRVSRAGLVVVSLNRWSAGGLSRRWGRDAGGSLLRAARDFSLPELRDLLRRSVGGRNERIYWKSAVFPPPIHRVVAPIPFGAVLGAAVVFEQPVPRGG